MSAARCVICDFVVEDTTGLKACPRCGTTGLPCDTADDVTVKINWHELRILGIWAEHYANQIEPQSTPTNSSRQCIYSITRRLEVQFPDKSPLTLSGELRQLKKEFPGMETNVPLDEGFDPTQQQ